MQELTARGEHGDAMNPLLSQNWDPYRWVPVFYERSMIVTGGGRYLSASSCSMVDEIAIHRVASSDSAAGWSERNLTV